MPATAEDFAGTWTGAYAITSTTPPSGGAGARTFVMRLVSAGNRVEGVLVSNGSALLPQSMTGNLAGAVGPDYRLVLDGFTPAASTNDAYGDVTIHLTLWLSEGALHGIIQYERLTSSGEVSRKVAGEVTTGTITTVSRTSAPPDTFAGTWQGRYLVRTCDVSGWDTCYLTPVGDTAPLELVLSQAGNQVTGSVTVTYPPFAVSGEATGSMLQLAGSATYQNGQWTKIRRLLMFSATRDAVGRLTGTVTWQDEDIRPDGVKYLTTQSVELQAVVQVR